MIQISKLLYQAIQCHQTGQFREAEALYRQVLAISEAQPEAHCNLGILLHDAGALEPAASHLRRAVQLNGRMVQAWNSLGVVLRKQERSSESLEAFTQAMRLAPNAAGVKYNMALLLRQTRVFEDALSLAQQASASDPSNLGMSLTVGDLLLDLDRGREALTHFESLACRFPAHPGPKQGLGMAWLALNQLEAAGASFEALLALEPDDVEGHFTLGVVRLLQGDFARGLPEYEWRLRRPENAEIERRKPGRRWCGSPLGDQSLLIYTEQGIGDFIHFARYLPHLHCRRLVVEVPATMHRLLSSLAPGAEVVLPGQPVEGIDVHASLMSLANLLGTQQEDIPADVPYLRPSADGARAFSVLLGPRIHPRVGICWRGSPTHWNDRRRSLPAARVKKLLACHPEAEWISLQVPTDAEMGELLTGSLAITNHIGDVQDTVSLMANLDLVVTVDTSIAHLAGALGIPTLVLLPFTPDWRWMLDRCDSPWYPSLRLFRQPHAGGWDEAVEALSMDLKERIRSLSAR